MTGYVLLGTILLNFSLLFYAATYGYPRYRSTAFRSELWSVRDALVFNKMSGALGSSSIVQDTLSHIDVLIRNARRLTVLEGLLAFSAALSFSEKINEGRAVSLSTQKRLSAGLPQAEEQLISGYLDRIENATLKQVWSGSLVSLFLVPTLAAAAVLFSISPWHSASCATSLSQRSALRLKQLLLTFSTLLVLPTFEATDEEALLR